MALDDFKPWPENSRYRHEEAMRKTSKPPEEGPFHYKVGEGNWRKVWLKLTQEAPRDQQKES